MRVPLNWLAEFVPLPADREALARRLTFAGIEVTGIERTGGDWEGVVVGRVLEVAPHPNADRLRLVTVDRGGGERPTVVCGAPDVAAGQDIAFAGLGAVLADPATGKPRRLKKSRIRGVVSGGMVCSEAELGLSGEHAGILVLDTEAPPGTPLAEALGETVFVLDLTPNRVDALSILGVAREVAALTGAPLTLPEADPAAAGPEIAGRAAAEIADPRLCRRFTVALIEEVTVGPSPDWIEARLTAAGLRPINNLVDITNYVMLECGQPVHAFDYDRVRDGRLTARPAAAGESLVTLDGQRLELDPERLVIADASGPVALAGVMGGRATEITDSTRRVLLEAANFDPVSVRRTARRYDLFTDAARRFSWGLPPELAAFGSARVCRLLAEHAGGRVAAGRVDTWPAPEPPTRIRLRRSRIPQVLGMDPAPEAVEGALTGLGFSMEAADGAEAPAGRGDDGESRNGGGGALSVGVPWWRRDVRVPDDLVEEVARVLGYDDLPAAPLEGAIPHHPPLPARDLRDRVRDLGVSAGLTEARTYSLVSGADLAAVLSEDERRAAPALRVRNPLGEARDSLRTSLRPGLLRAAAFNFDRGARSVALFEVARLYRPRPDGAAGRPEEVEAAAAILSGARRDRYGNPTGEDLDFFDAKATLERVLAGLRLDAEFRPVEAFGFAPGLTAAVLVGGVRLGTAGQVETGSAAAFGLEEDAFCWELDLAALLRAAPDPAAPTPAAALPRFPAAAEDFAFLVGPDTLAGDLVREAESHPLVVEARVFDDYRFSGGDTAGAALHGSPGNGPPAGGRSVGLRVLYRAPNRTLDENDIAKVRRTILKRMKSNLGAVVRERA